MDTSKAQPEIEELDLWLDRATAGLPPDAVDSIKVELADHYGEAAEHYVNSGKARRQASRSALADLGDARLVARGFQDTYLGPRRYRLAMAAAAAMMLVYMLFPMSVGLIPLTSDLPAQLIMLLRYDLLLPVLYDLLLFGLSFTVLSVTEQLLRWRFDLEQQRGFRLAKVGLALQIVADVASLLVFGASMNVGAEQVRGPVAAESGLELLLTLATMLGFLMLGLGLLVIGRGLWRWPGELYGLRRALAGAMGLMGLAMATSGLWLTLGVEPLLFLDALAVIVSHMLMWPLMILLYFRVLYRRPPDAGYA